MSAPLPATKELTIEGQKRVLDRAFPLALGPASPAEARPERLAATLAERSEQLRSLLLRHGAVLLRGFGLTGPGDFEAMLDAAAFVNMPYIGGAAPRSQVTHRRILTANESPSSEPIPFHHEMAQVPEPPAYVFFYCDLAPEQGGETAIVHSHRVYERFSAIAPEFAAKVERTGVRYRRVMPAVDDASSAIGRSWPSTFGTKDRAEAEARMRALGSSWRWLEGGDLETLTAAVPAIRTEPRSGLKTFFNSVVAAYTGWTDARNDPERAVRCGDDSPVDGAALRATAAAMDEECVKLRWQQGDLLLVDNSLVLHARQPYEGERRILASIATA